jgi:hypothetical protein
MPLSTKKFTISNSGLNSYGFRMLTAGADLSEYNNNPIVLWMHNRSWKGTKDEVLPLGYMTDLKIDGDEITGIPFFDDKDEFAMSIYHKVENGTLRTCSAGAVPIELSEDAKHLLPGQTRATVTKWKLKEVSITDIGANPGALAVALYDQDAKLITLSDNNGLEATIPAIKLSSNMKIIELSAPELCTKLKLKEDAKAAEVMEKISYIASENVTLADANTALTEENAELKLKLETQEKEAKAGEITALLSQAKLDRKITADQEEALIELAGEKPEALEKLLAKMPSNPTLQSSITTGTGGNSGTVALADMSWDDLHKDGKLIELKATNLEAYREVFKKKFNKYPSE